LSIASQAAALAGRASSNYSSRRSLAVHAAGCLGLARRRAANGILIDVMPTFAAAAGARFETSWEVDGANMLDVWTGQAQAPQRTLFWEWRTEAGSMLAAMRGDFKLLEMGPNRFLYDVQNDPPERRTVAAEYPEIYEQLQAELKAWLATEVK
jgi:arylsulfatase A-like enzyme